MCTYHCLFSERLHQSFRGIVDPFLIVVMLQGVEIESCMIHVQLDDLLRLANARICGAWGIEVGPCCTGENTRLWRIQ